MYSLFAKWSAGMAVLLLLSSLVIAPQVFAADPALTVNQKKAYYKTVAAADSVTAVKLKQQYGDLEALLKSSQDWDRKITLLHKQNSVKETSLRKQIVQIDSDKLDKLKQTYEQANSHYKKLNALYHSANQQLAAARHFKNPFLTSIFRAQADGLKLSVQLARQDKQAKDAAYKAARSSAQAKMKKLRGILSGIDPIQVRIRAAKRALNAPKDSRSTVWNSFKKSLTKQDAKTACNLLVSVNGLTRQLIDRQQQLYILEDRISSLNHAAESQLKTV